jgi:hypothetical protein
MQQIFFKPVCAYFLRKCAFFGQNTTFSSLMWEIFTIQIFFLYSKDLEGFKYAKKNGLPSEFRKRSFFPIGHGLYLYIPSIFISHGAPGAKNSLKNKQKKNDQNQN